MEKLEFYNRTFNYFYEMIPNDFRKVVFLIDSSRRDGYCPVNVEFFVFLDDTEYVAWYKLPLYSEKYQELYNGYVSFFKENYLSIPEFNENNILTLIFTSDGQVYDEYETINFGDDFNSKSAWRNEWFNAYLVSQYGFKPDITNGPIIDDFVDRDVNNLITEAFGKVYPEEKDSHICYQSFLPYAFGGTDPITFLNVYDGKDYWHLVTEGCSAFCDYEFTYLLPKKTSVNANEIRHVLDFLQPIAKTIMQGENFKFYDYIYDGKFTSVDYEQKSLITSFITVPDPYVSQIDGLKFMCLVGITNEELKSIVDKKISIEELFNKIGTCVTDYDRKSVI